MRDILPNTLLRRFIFVALLASISLAIFLALLVRAIPVANTDIALTTELQEHTSRSLYYIFRIVSFLGDPLVAAGTTIVAAIILIGIQYQREALFMLLVPVADLIGVIIKNIVQRPRPNEFLVKIYEQASGSSFPSGHVIHVVVFFGYLFTLMFILKEIAPSIRYSIAVFSLAMIVLISLSRIYLGAHWASDVIGGYLVAFPLLALLLLTYFRITSPRQL